MKYAMADSDATYPYSLTMGPMYYWPSQTNSMGSWEQPAKVCPPTTIKSVIARFESKDNEDGYDSSESTSCETHDSVETSSWDGTSFKSVSEQPDSLRGDSATVRCGTLESLRQQKQPPTLSWADRASVILPALAEWANILGLTHSLTSIAELHCLVVEHPATRELAESSRKVRKHWDLECLRESLKDCQMQQLIEMLTSQEAPPSVQISIDTLAVELQQELTKVNKPRKQASKLKHRR